jgi:hypothetical protein
VTDSMFFLLPRIRSFVCLSVLLQMLKGRYKQKEVEDDIAQKQSSWQVCTCTDVSILTGLYIKYLHINTLLMCDYRIHVMWSTIVTVRTRYRLLSENILCVVVLC